MKYKIGTPCFIIDEDGNIRKGRVSGFYEKDYMVQLIGECGIYRVKESEVHESEEAAEAASQKAMPKKVTVSFELSDD